VRATPPRQVRRDLEIFLRGQRPDALLRPFVDRPRQAVGWLCDGLEAAWDAAVAPHWPRVRGLLAELGTPVSTTDLARRLGLTPGGVSQHLQALAAAGLVAGERDGRSVLYLRTPVADRLVGAVAGASPGM
jgi:DNA-binding transcriptional ArsR family regulator